MKKDKSYGIVPICKNGSDYSFLVVKQGGESGHWAFPKGHAEAGESDVMAAAREMTEETGITPTEIISTASFSERYVWNDRGTLTDKTVYFFPALFDSEISPQLDEKEVVDARWLDYDRALELITFKETKQVLTDAKKWLDEQY